MGALKEEKKKQVAAMEELRREVDIFINSFLKQEGVEADKQEWLRQLLDDVKALSEELVLATKEEREQRKAIAQLNGELHSHTLATHPHHSTHPHHATHPHYAATPSPRCHPLTTPTPAHPAAPLPLTRRARGQGARGCKGHGRGA